MNRAINKIRVWRRVIEEDAVERGLKEPRGHQNQGWDETLTPATGLANSRLGECQVYSGARIPVNPTYLTVEVAIAQLPCDQAEKESFRMFVFHRVRTLKSLDSKAVKSRQKELGLLLLASLSMPDMVADN